MRTSTKTVLLLVSLTAVHGVLLAERLPLAQYTLAQGLPDEQVRQIFRDSKGFLWFCTAAGLSRFDGYEFVSYGAPDGLPPGGVSRIIETRDGGYLLATTAGVVRFDASAAGHNFKQVWPDRGANHALSLLEDRAGRLWIGTEDGLYRGGSRIDLGFVATAMEPREAIHALLEDHAGVVWAGATEGLYRFAPEGRPSRYTTINGLPSSEVRSLLEDSQGRVWTGTTLGLARLAQDPPDEGRVVTEVYTSVGRSFGWVVALLESGDGTIFAGTSNGLVALESAGAAGQPRRATLYSTGNGLTSPRIESLAMDQHGSLWLGTHSAGAMRLVRPGLTAYGEAEGLADLQISSIFETMAGELCVVAEHRLHQLSGGRLVATRPNIPDDALAFNWSWYQAELQDHLGEWWIPTHRGLYRFPAATRAETFGRLKPSHIYSTKDGLSGDDIFRVFEDGHGDLWIGTSSAAPPWLTRWERRTGRFHRYNQSDGVPQGLPTAFTEDRDRNLWIGLYTGGVVRHRAGRFEYFSVQDGFPAGLIRALHLDDQGRLWIGTEEGGAARIDDPTAEHPRFVRYGVEDGLSSNLVASITQDALGRIYLGTRRGIDRLDPGTGRIRHFGTGDGLPNNFINVAYRDHSDTLWFGTLGGLAHLVPDPDQAVPSPPQVLISSVRVAGRPHTLGLIGETHIERFFTPVSPGPIEIEFFGLSFDPRGPLRYQYRLAGADLGWSEPIARRSVIFPNLEPGTYRFIVRSVDPEGHAGESAADVAFTVPSPLWLRWWFLSASLALTAAAAYALHRIRLGRLLAVERVRTRLATDLHDDIGASLSQIAILSEVARQEVILQKDFGGLAGPLSRIADVSRQTVDTMSDIVWATNPARDHLSDLTQRMRRFASDMLPAHGVEFRFTAPAEAGEAPVDPATRRQIYLIFKECLNNAARHSSCRRIDITLVRQAGALLLKVSDDGIGFDTSRRPDGHGLSSMERRARELGGALTIRSTPGSGTTVEVTAPVT